MALLTTRRGHALLSYGSLERELEVARRLARWAGALLRCHQPNPKISYKGRGEVVTAGDLEADTLIHSGLQAAFPQDAIYSEETPDPPDRLASPRVWIIDPLDGTSNFVDKGDEYTVSIGLCIGHRAVLGVVYNPARDQLFAGYLGLGVSLNGCLAQAGQTELLEDARLTVSRKEWQHKLGKLVGQLAVQPMASMAYKLARVAAGMDDGVFSLTPRKDWGTCAGVALVHAAGGLATWSDGREIEFNRPELRQPLGLVAAGPRLHKPLLETVRTLDSPQPREPGARENTRPEPGHETAGPGACE